VQFSYSGTTSSPNQPICQAIFLELEEANCMFFNTFVLLLMEINEKATEF
jgi:hypothetical protein